MRGFFRKWPFLIGALFLTSGVQVINSWLTVPQVKGWYQTLERPEWSPPGWVFGPVWTVLYIMMALALYCVILKHQNRKLFRQAYFAWGLQLFFNALWTPLFFLHHKIFWALFDSTLLWLAILWCLTVFYYASKRAFYLMIPYFLWVSYAWALNAFLYWANECCHLV